MLSLSALWICILVATVLVFVVSSVLHMMLPIHKGDYRKLPKEAELLTAMRTHGVAPGTYSFPFPDSMKDMASPEMIEKYKQGPVGTVTVLPNGVPAIAKSLVLWLLYLAIVSIFVAYLATIGLSDRVSDAGLSLYQHGRAARLRCPSLARVDLEGAVLDRDRQVHPGRCDLQPGHGRDVCLVVAPRLLSKATRRW